VIVAAFKTARRANEVVAEIKGKGMPASIRTDAASEWHQIVVGPFRSPAEAETVQAALARDGFPDSRVSPPSAVRP
jgi:cell division septation protein DedD